MKWLLKSEPDVYSFDQLLAEGETVWNGVRNNAARLHLRAMKAGDEALFYHSNIGKEAVGLCRISHEAYPDPTDESGQWVAVSVQPIARLSRPVTLAEMKAEPALAEFQLIRQSRLSVVPVRDAEWELILKMAG
ncbi:MAG: EVE domain-containing protein [Sandaracinobacter sp.]